MTPWWVPALFGFVCGGIGAVIVSFIEKKLMRSPVPLATTAPKIVQFRRGKRTPKVHDDEQAWKLEQDRDK